MEDENEYLPEKRKRERPDRTVQASPGDNTRYLAHNLEVNALGDEKIDMRSIEAVRQRMNDYFQICIKNDMKPSFAGMALAFGVTRKALYEWTHDKIKYIPPAVQEELKKAYIILNSQMEDYMQNGKINPVAGIFLMKNNMDYVDKQEISVAPANPLGDEIPSEDLRRKYLGAIEGEFTEITEDEN